jgi:hypothetical protein
MDHRDRLLLSHAGKALLLLVSRNETFPSTAQAQPNKRKSGGEILHVLLWSSFKVHIVRRAAGYLYGV